MSAGQTQAQEAEQFADDEWGWAKRLEVELSAARKELRKWHSQGRRVEKRFRDEREETDTTSRWNLYSANIITQRAMMYGKTPSAGVTRKFGDADDDVARVAAQMMERLLNCDIQRDSDTYEEALENALFDFLNPALGFARCRYVAEFETREVEAQLDAEGKVLAEGYQEEVKTSEDVEIDHIRWDDVLCGAGARTWTEVQIVFLRVQMTRKQLKARFNTPYREGSKQTVGELVPLNSKRTQGGESKSGTPWDRADVWEVWSKDGLEVFWYVEGFERVLDRKKDPLQLAGFWPFPRPMAANLGTDTIVPKPDFALCQDLYNQIDVLSTRIESLIDSLKVAGVYDKTAGDLQRLVRAGPNEMIPADNWAMFANKGGLRGLIDWFPLEMVASTLDKLRDCRQELVQTVYQVSGMSDIVRGQQVENGTPGEAALKARFSSVRMQARQDEFARFASDLLRIKCEIICKHFDERTIIERSNVMYTPDAALAQPAVRLLKDRYAHYRIEVKPENINLTDFAAMKAERTELLMALSGFFQAMAPIAQSLPGSLPFLLEIAKWTVAATRGASTIEGVFDRAIASAKQMAAQPQPQQPPDPKLIAQQMKGAQEMQKIQADLQADLVRTQAEVEADGQREQNQAMWNTVEAQRKASIASAHRQMGGGGGPNGFGPGGL